MELVWRAPSLSTRWWPVFLRNLLVWRKLASPSGSMPFCVELDNLKDTDAPIHQPAAMLVAAD